MEWVALGVDCAHVVEKENALNGRHSTNMATTKREGYDMQIKLLTVGDSGEDIAPAGDCGCVRVRAALSRRLPRRVAAFPLSAHDGACTAVRPPPAAATHTPRVGTSSHRRTVRRIGQPRAPRRPTGGKVVRAAGAVWGGWLHFPRPIRTRSGHVFHCWFCAL